MTTARFQNWQNLPGATGKPPKGEMILPSCSRDCGSYLIYTRTVHISNLTVDGDRNANQKNLQPPKSGTDIFIRELI